MALSSEVFGPLGILSERRRRVRETHDDRAIDIRSGAFHAPYEVGKSPPPAPAVAQNGHRPQRGEDQRGRLGNRRAQPVIEVHRDVELVVFLR